MEKDGEFSLPSEFPYEFDFGSETEEEEEDKVALIRQLSRTTFSTQPSQNKVGFSGSPKSTLCGVESCKLRKGSQNFQSYQQISPPPTPFAQLDSPWDLVHAEQVANRGLLSPYSAYSATNYLMVSAGGLGGGGCDLNFQREGGFLADTSVWPPIRVQPQQQLSQMSQSNVKAGFHGGCVPKRDCAGTGVFLPRIYGNNTTTSCRKEPAACQTSLLPIRPIQDIKKGFPSSTHSPARNAFHGHFGEHYDVLMARRYAILAARHLQLMKTELAMKHQELFLPQEWTY